MQKLPYYLVKVTDKKWADSLQDGNVFMRAISCFGDLKNRVEDANNSFRGDSLECLSHSFGNGHNPCAYISTPSGIEEIVPNQIGVIDVLKLREKIFCMYSFEYSENDGLILPDKRIEEFGDTAVIITDGNEFLRRIASKIIERYDYKYWISFMRVSYDVDLSQNRFYNEFSKTKSYEWQKEFRIALNLSQGKFDKNTLADLTDYARITFPGIIEEDTNPDSIAESLVLEIGSIRDISVSVPVKQFIEGKDIVPLLKEYPPKFIKPLVIPRKPQPTFFRLVAKLP